MSLQNSLKRLCTPAVYRRGQQMALANRMVHRRRCRYEGDETILDARVDSSASWDGPHRPQVVIDEQRGEVSYYECDCDAARGTKKPCKHVVALVFDYCARPERYEGHDALARVVTSRPLARLIEGATRPVASLVGAQSEGRPGTVSLEVTLAYEAGFSARFRLEGERGGYVLKSISDFVGAVEAKDYVSYGKRLSFVHVPDAFTPQGCLLVDFLVRAVRNRRAYAFDRAVGAGPLGTNGAPQREMHLSSVELWDMLGLLMGATVRFEDRSASGASNDVVRQLRVIAGDPELSFAFEAVAGGSFELARTSDVRVVHAGGRALAWHNDLLYCCSDSFSKAVQPIIGVLGPGTQRLVLAQRDVSAFAAHALPLLERAAQVEVPRELEEQRPLPCELQFYLDRDKDGVVCEGFAVYGNQRFLLGGQDGDSSAADGEELVIRDVQAEAQGRAALKRYFARDERGRLRIDPSDEQKMAAFVFEGAAELQRVGTVFATDAFDRLKSASRPHATVEVGVHANLLDIRISADGLSSRELSELLESYRLRKRYHLLRDGSFVDLSTAQVEEAATLVDELGLGVSDLAKGAVEIPAYRALLLDAEARDSLGDCSLKEYLAAIDVRDSSPRALPEELADILRPYQVEGFEWMSALVERDLAGILADEMGLGKSLQLIALLRSWQTDARAVGPSLVVCPASLVYNWLQEFERFAPELEVSVVAGTADEREIARQASCDVLVTSYDALRRDVAGYASMRLWLVALDEAQYIKNHTTLAARAVKELSCAHRFALTGTPVENRLSELWSIFDFLLPGLLGSYEQFHERFECRVEDDASEVVSRLGRMLGPFVLRRTKREVLQDLPDKLEQVVYARMGHEQRALYNAQVLELRSRLADERDCPAGGARMQVLAALMRLRQTCCDPGLVFEDYEGGSCKVDTILTIVRRVVDASEKLLLFSQFTGFLEELAKRLDEEGVSHFMLTGATPKRRRLELVNSFNHDETSAFLISLKAGGTGLNLTGASVVIHADPWWNAAAQDQATDRAHRIGQTRDVVVYKVICANTLEERILELQRRKAELATRVVGTAAAQGLGSLSMAELAELLG